MAKVIQDERSVVVEPWWVRGKIVYIGLAMGFLWWILVAILRKYVVEPLACRDLSTAQACVDSIGVSGSIAAIIVAIAGIFLLIRYLQPRPIIIALATAILLWSLGSLVDGLAWYWAIMWGVVLYGLSYGLFSMVARIQWLWVSLVVAVVIVVGTSILVAL